MHRFQYRHPRFSVDLPAQICIANRALAGRCTDIGIKGMRLTLPDTVVPGGQGIVFLHHEGQTVEATVRVSRVGATYCGLEFVGVSHDEQSAMVHLVARVSVPHRRHLMCLVPRTDVSLGGPALQV